MPKVADTKKAPAKKEKVAAKQTTKEAAEPKKRTSGKFNDLTSSQIKTLEALNDGTAMTRQELADETGIQKGWSKLLGKQEDDHEDSLLSKNLVKATVPQEGEGRAMKYMITAAGKQALAKAQKEMAKAGKD